MGDWITPVAHAPREERHLGCFDFLQQCGQRWWCGGGTSVQPQIHVMTVGLLSAGHAVDS